MVAHPLDPLSATEFQSTAAILRRDQGVTDSWRFASIELKEPAKADVKAWRPGDAVPRRSLSVLLDRETNQTYEAVVDLVGDRVDSWTHQPGACPNFTLDEYHDVDHALHEHPEVLARLAARGITDPSLVLFDVWTYGAAVMPEQWRDRRLGWCDLWMRETPQGNPYAHLISGLKIIVDVNTLEVLEIEDHHDYGLPEVDGEYDPQVRGTQERTDLKPLEISQPEGVSFTVDGNEVRWQNWSMRLGFNFREGPVIYQVAFDDQGTKRDIAYRMSFAEMVVPYRDPGFDHYRRTAFDIGEWGLGYMVTSLELGCDCLGEIVYVDAVMPDTRGEPIEIPRAVCLHEEDNAVLWKHVDAETRCSGPPDAPDGRVDAHHGGQLRVPGVLAVLSGRKHRVRGASQRLDGDNPHAERRRQLPVRHDGRHPDVRPVPPALHHRQTRPRHRRRREHRSRGGLSRRSDQRCQPVRASHVHRGYDHRDREPVSQRLQLGNSANLEGDQPQQGEPAREQHRLQAGTRRGDPVAAGLRLRRYTSERRSLTTPFG